MNTRVPSNVSLSQVGPSISFVSIVIRELLGRMVTMPRRAIPI